MNAVISARILANLANGMALPAAIAKATGSASQ